MKCTKYQHIDNSNCSLYDIDLHIFEYDNGFTVKIEIRGAIDSATPSHLFISKGNKVFRLLITDRFNMEWYRDKLIPHYIESVEGIFNEAHNDSNEQ